VTVGVAGGLATLEAGIPGQLTLVAFVIGAARAHEVTSAGGAMLIGLALTWGSLLVSSGGLSVIVGWLVTGLAALVVGWLGMTYLDTGP